MELRPSGRAGADHRRRRGSTRPDPRRAKKRVESQSTLEDCLTYCKCEREPKAIRRGKRVLHCEPFYGIFFETGHVSHFKKYSGGSKSWYVHREVLLSRPWLGRLVYVYVPSNPGASLPWQGLPIFHTQMKMDRTISHSKTLSGLKYDKSQLPSPSNSTIGLL